MYKPILTVSLAVLVIAAIASAGEGEDKSDKWRKFRNMNLTCKGEALNMKELEKSKHACFKEVFPESGTKDKSTTPTPEARKEWFKKFRENSLCIEVCSWKKQEFINADNTYNAEKADKFVKANFPASVQASLKKSVDDCASAHGKSFSTDNKCAGFKDFQDCKMKKFMEICEIKMKTEDEASE